MTTAEANIHKTTQSYPKRLGSITARPTIHKAAEHVVCGDRDPGNKDMTLDFSERLCLPDENAISNSPLNSASTTEPSTTEDADHFPNLHCNITGAACNDCGVFSIDTADSRIVHGVDAEPNEFPYQVHIFLVLNATYRWCGGSVINGRWILTAAHCFFVDFGYPILLEYYEVGYGNVHISELKRVRPKDRFIHEKYVHLVDNFAYDIALLELEDDIYTSDPSIHPICLAKEADIPFGGKAVVTGWGTLQYGGAHPTTLQKVVLDVINITYCASLEQLPENISTVVCALTDYKDSCQGDSGGPLVAKTCSNHWVQIGIVSYGYQCARPKRPGIYTRVSAFREWIITKTGLSPC
ncbi:U21-ctenitoxin-Pn1a-like [Macrobrachium rosenbergii]|uniref:U21-ctenitoxin-Pn1a-like n=1 Tax=Macrobrachium rosenbergii TaxID=79674 RepID=UPI0034D46B33